MLAATLEHIFVLYFGQVMIGVPAHNTLHIRDEKLLVFCIHDSLRSNRVRAALDCMVSVATIMKKKDRSAADLHPPYQVPSLPRGFAEDAHPWRPPL